MSLNPYDMGRRPLIFKSTWERTRKRRGLMYPHHQGKNPVILEHTTIKKYSHKGYHKNGGGQRHVAQHVSTH